MSKRTDSDDEAPRLSRDDKRRLSRRAARTSEELVDELLEIREHMLVQLPLDPEVLAAVRELRGMFAHKERPRQLRFVTRLVRDADTEALAKAIAEVKAGGGEDANLRKAQRWRERLVREGDDAIQAFVEEHPSADRQELRALVRKAQRGKPEEMGRIMVELATWLRAAVAESPDE